MQPMQHQQPSQESLSRPDSLILVGLVGGPKHAVALREATQQAEGVFIEPGTLYRILARLEVAFQCLSGSRSSSGLVCGTRALHRLLLIVLFVVLFFVGSIALAVKKYRVEVADLPKQEPLQQVQQAHEHD